MCWPIVGGDVTAAIQYFFFDGKLLKQVKNTFIALIPKSKNPSSTADYRPISLTNVLYKIISRIIASRIKPLMHKIINQSQSAFVPGRSISDNILLSHDLLRSFHLKKGKPCVRLKIDLSKAFDNIRWDYIEAALCNFYFPSVLVNWIMECISQPSFSVLVNGTPCGFFNCNRDICQGCPLSPYIFSVVMEFFSANLSSCALNGLMPFPFIRDDMAISHLFFADDVHIIFA